MNYDAKTGLIDDARQVLSPNFDERPDASDIDTIVIHAISLPPGKFGGDAIERFFVINWTIPGILSTRR